MINYKHKTIEFVKAHGLGNDIIIFESVDYDLIQKNACFIADRKYGIGCDCIVLYDNGKVKFWNSDGSTANLCGNGCRCLIKYLAEKYSQTCFNFEVNSGSIVGEIYQDKILMAYPGKANIAPIANGYSVNIGNQHTVIFESNDSILDYIPQGNLMPLKAQGNLMFLKNRNDSWFMDIYEAGVGETNACGSGAMAASLAIWEKYQHTDPVTINMKGGTLEMHYRMKQIGSAELVFTGQIDLV